MKKINKYKLANRIEKYLFIALALVYPMITKAQDDVLEKAATKVNEYMANVKIIANVVIYVIIVATFIVSALKLKSDEQANKMKIVGTTILVLVICGLALYFMTFLGTTTS